MNTEQQTSLFDLASRALDEAERVWKKVSDEMLSFSLTNESLVKKAAETQIPGYPIIEDGEPIVDEFICLIADMRGSTMHLLQDISKKIADVTQLQRVYYETSALLPSLAQVIAWEDGRVTEYLGDGVLGLFKATPETDKAVYAANRAAKNCIEAVRMVVNPLLKNRYHLPDLEIGVGMAYSKAVISLVGLDTYKQPKVFGECVFRASKLSKGKNIIIIDKKMHWVWPSSKDGTQRFFQRKCGDIEGFQVL